MIFTILVVSGSFHAGCAKSRLLQAGALEFCGEGSHGLLDLATRTTLVGHCRVFLRWMVSDCYVWLLKWLMESIIIEIYKTYTLSLFISLMMSCIIKLLVNYIRVPNINIRGFTQWMSAMPNIFRHRVDSIENIHKLTDIYDLWWINYCDML